jgi:hypothetical protein
LDHSRSCQISSFLCRNCKTPLAGITNVPASLIPHLLGTNSVPSDAEDQNVRALVAAVRSDISQLDADIAHAQSVLGQLTKEREALKAYVKVHAVFISPVRQAPDEIWSEIFSHCLPSSVERPESMKNISPLLVFNPRNAPALLLRVCRDWRAIALSSPRLWSWISLFSKKAFQPTADVIQTWLRRSQAAPLSVILEPFHRSLGEISSFFQGPVVQSVLEQSHRWRAVHIRFPLFLFSSFNNDLPQLEELHLNFYSAHPRDAPIRGDLDIFRNAPNLRRIKIYDLPPFPISDIKLPWAQLTQFSSQRAGQSIINLCTLLRLASNLVSVDWLLAHDSQISANALPTVQHLYLRDLCITIGGNTGSSLRLDCLSLPSLRTFKSICLGGQCLLLPETSASKNFPALESFELDSLSIIGSQLIDCMKPLQSVSCVTLTMGITNSGFRPDGRLRVHEAVEELLVALCCTTAQRGPVLLPRLKTITIHCFALRADEVQVRSKFFDMIESRWRIPGPSHDLELASQSHMVSRIDAAFLKFDLDYRPNANPADLDRLQKLRDEGLKVQLLYS